VRGRHRPEREGARVGSSGGRWGRGPADASGPAVRVCTGADLGLEVGQHLHTGATTLRAAEAQAAPLHVAAVQAIAPPALDADAALQQGRMIAPPPPPSPQLQPPQPPHPLPLLPQPLLPQPLLPQPQLQLPQQALPPPTGCSSFQAISSFAHQQEQKVLKEWQVVEEERQRLQQQYKEQTEELRRQTEELTRQLVQALEPLDHRLNGLDKELEAIEEVTQMMRSRSSG